jgi:hypothetical protein
LGRNFGGAWRKFTRLTVRSSRDGLLDRLLVGEKWCLKFLYPECAGGIVEASGGRFAEDTFWECGEVIEALITTKKANHGSP